MKIVIAFFLGYFLNEGRFLFKVWGNNLNYIKNKIIIKELGFHYLLMFIFLNFLKGYVPFCLFSGHSHIYDVFLALVILLGFYLGFKPLFSEGSELIVFSGMVASYNWQFAKISLALFLGAYILTKSYNFPYVVLGIYNIFSISKYNYALVLMGLIILVNYARYIHAPFSPYINTINKKTNPLFSLKRGEEIYESILHSFAKFFKKNVEKSY